MLKNWKRTVNYSDRIIYDGIKSRKRVDIVKITGDFAGAVKSYWDFRVLHPIQGGNFAYYSHKDFPSKSKALAHAMDYMRGND